VLVEEGYRDLVINDAFAAFQKFHVRVFAGGTSLGIGVGWFGTGAGWV